MSDDAKDEQAASAATGDGFTPAPPPPALSEEEAAAANAAMSGDTVLPDGTIAVPQDTAKRALEAVQILVENNRSASQQLESLMGIVLDAAEVANRSASAVATTGTHVNKAAEKLIDGAKNQYASQGCSRSGCRCPCGYCRHLQLHDRAAAWQS